MSHSRNYGGKRDTGYSDWFNQASQPLIGNKKRFDTMQRRLSIGFSLTRQEKLDNGMSTYAKNRNSKGKLVPILYTLTYPSNEHWNPKDITNFCKKITNYAERNWAIKLRYFWVAETTSKGVIHYHLTTWIPRNKRLPKASEPIVINNRSYPPLWKYRAEVAGVKKGVYSYLLKYISKGCIIEGLGISKPKLDDKGNQIYKKGKPQIIKPRLFGYGGFTPNQREFMTYSMLPRYVRDYFNSVPFGDKIQRIKGGWQRNKKNMVERIGKYYQYGNDLLLTNYSLWFDEINGNKIIGYDYGVNWSTIPEENTSDVWYPF